MDYRKNSKENNNYFAYQIGELEPKIIKINDIGIKATNTNNKHSIIIIMAIISTRTLINILLITIPKMTEKTTNPCLYSFFSGLKNVLKRSPRDKIPPR